MDSGAPLHILEEWRLALVKSGVPSRRMLLRLYRYPVPACIRGALWQRLLRLPGDGAWRLNHYRSFIQTNLQSSTDNCAKTILRDIDRTFPSHELFRESACHGQQQLMRLLMAVSARHHSVGYCQGMGFIAGVLLTCLPESDAFFAFDYLMDELQMCGIFEPSLGRLPLIFFQLERLLIQHLPKLDAHFDAEQVDVTMFAASWCMTLFASTATPALAARLYDVIFSEGYVALLRFSIAILKLLQETLLALPLEGILSTLKLWTDEIPSPEALMIVAEGLISDISDAHIAKLTDAYTEQQRSGQKQLRSHKQT